MPGNPFKPQASGYAQSQNPVAQLMEVFGRLSSVVENVFHGFRHLADAVKNMDRTVSRIAFLAAAMVGPRNTIPWALRDTLLPPRGGGGGGSGSKSFDQVITAAVSGTSGEATANTGGSNLAKAIAVQMGTLAPTGAGAGGGGGSSTTVATGGGGGFWDRWYGRGLSKAGSFFSNLFGKAKGVSAWWNDEKNVATRSAFSRSAGTAFLASSITGASMLRSANPYGFDTLSKSFEYFLAKSGGGLNGPTMAASSRLQKAGNWMGEHPGLTKFLGWVIGVTVVGTGLTLALGATVRAVIALGTAAMWSARMMGLQASAAGAASVAGKVPAVVPGGAPAAAGGASRFSGVLGVLGRVAGPAAAIVEGYNTYDEYDKKDWPALQRRSIRAIAPTAPGTDDTTQGWTKDAGLWAAKKVSRLFYTEDEINNKVDNLKRWDHWSNPLFDPSTRGEKKPDSDMLLPNPSQVEPSYTTLSEAYKQIQLSMLQAPIDQSIKQEQMKNMEDAIARGAEAGVKAGMESKDQGKALTVR